MKKSIFCLVILVVAVALLFIGFSFSVNKNEGNKIVTSSRNILVDIKKHYNTTVLVVRNTNLYEKSNDKFISVGKIYKDVILDLDRIEVLSENDEYFKISNSSYYVNYQDVTPNKKINYDKSYKNYVVFDKNIKTKSNIDLYYENKSAIHLDQSLEFEVIINDNDMYYVEFLDRLFSVRKSDIVGTVKNDKVNMQVAKELAVLNYHFFYDPSIGESCNESICLKKSMFEQHLKYIKDNDYYTIDVNDLNLWMDKKINLPKKSVLITVDDGAMGTDTHLIELLEKYDLKGTLFLITAWWPKDKYLSSNLDIQSHGNDIHLENYCKNVSRGAKGLCLSKEQLINDFKKSIQKLNGENTAICYPFYLYNQTMFDAMKEVGFKLGFTGGEQKVTQNTNKYKIPRFVIYSDMGVEAIKKIID